MEGYDISIERSSSGRLYHIGMQYMYNIYKCIQYKNIHTYKPWNQGGGRTFAWTGRYHRWVLSEEVSQGGLDPAVRQMVGGVRKRVL